MSGDNILIKIKNLQSQGINYATSNNLSSQFKFIYIKDIKGNVLVPKEENKEISEFILAVYLELMQETSSWHLTANRINLMF